MSLRTRRDRNSVQQDLGSGFHFEPDDAALRSILNNEGVERAALARLSSLTPAKHVPGSFKNDADKLEFFEGASGKVFFRRKVATPKNERVNVKRFRNNPTAAKFAPMRMGPVSAQKNLGRSPLAVKSTNTPNVPNKFATEKKPKIGIPIHRESISEKKPVTTKSFLPKPNCGSRKSLYFSQPNENQKNGPAKQVAEKSNESFEFVRPAAVNFPLEPLTALTRESLRLLPRESRAWLDKIPRDSITFREIEKLMNAQDRNCVNDDDTCAFERMEYRIEPKDTKSSHPVVEKTVPPPTTTDDLDVMDNSLDESYESNGSFEARENELRTPKAVRTKEMTDTSINDENKENLEIDFQNLSLIDNKEEAVQINVQSYESPISKKYKKKHEMFGKNLTESPKSSATVRASPPLVKSVSMIDLNQSKELPLAKSSSVENLNQDLEISGLVSLDQMQNILSDLDRYRAEQDALERQKEQIFQKIQDRREQFKALWGVSPKSVNKIRTVIPVKKVPSPKKFRSPICESPAAFGLKSVDALSTASPLLSDTPPSSKPARQVRVRFNSGANLVKTPSPVQYEGSPFSPDSSPLPENMSARHSFSALRSSFSFLQTPKAAQHPKKRMVEEFSVVNSGRKEATMQAMPTPVALRSLSDRVHAELAKLYADSSDECEETQTANLMKKLTF